MPAIATDRPLQDAVEQVSRKTPVGSVLTSREWELVPAEIRDRAMFSSRVENERLLAEIQERLRARIELAKREGRTMDRGVFIEEMREELRKEGYKRGDAKRGGLQDLKSTRRLGLIWDMNIAQAQGYARWKADMTPEGLENEPCYELIRVMTRMERRAWPRIWSDAGGEFFDGPGSNDDYPLSPGRMIAAKNDPVWTRISRFGTPWPPFDWGSGMGLRGIDRDEAETLGVLGPDDEVLPLAAPFNSRHRMSVAGMPESGRESLRSTFGDAIRFDGDDIILQRELNPETYDQRKQDITESLRERARSIADTGRDYFRRVRSEDNAAAWPPGFDFSESEDEILAHTAAVAVGRKLLYHDEWVGYAQSVGALIRHYLPAEVHVAVIDGHVYAFRPDIVGLDEGQIHQRILDADMGRLLGYGQNMIDEPAVLVKLADADGKPLTSFLTAPASAKIYASARAKDWMHALGKTIRVFIAGMEVLP